MYASQKVRVFSSLRRSETHFRKAKGYQRASAITDSINIIQNTPITVYEVKHQEAVKTKLGKRTIWFSEVFQELFHHNFQASETRTRKKRGSKISMQC